jgi:hypothetical protein
MEKSMRRKLRLFGLVACAAAPVLAASHDDPPQGTLYSNEEQVYFAGEAKQPLPLRVNLMVVPTEGHGGTVPYTLAFVDAFGTEEFRPLPFADVAKQLGPLPHHDVLQLRLDGQTVELRRARPATCWVAIKKDKPKADGSPDWFFAQGVKLHDQGGRAVVGAGVADTQPVMIRMRNVIWPPKADGTPSTNKPSVVLYVHKPDQYDRSEAYVWGDPGAARIGINLRWMQASCGIDGMENPSAVTATSFRG